jgi:hypothetical protein
MEYTLRTENMQRALLSHSLELNSSKQLRDISSSLGLQPPGFILENSMA